MRLLDERHGAGMATEGPGLSKHVQAWGGLRAVLWTSLVGRCTCDVWVLPADLSSLLREFETSERMIATAMPRNMRVSESFC